MKITDLIKGFNPNPQRRLDFRELQALSEKARQAASVYNHKELIELIRQYNHSDEAVERIALAIVKSEPFHCPASAMNRYSIEMMDTLIDTHFMDKHGCLLSGIAPGEATPIHGLLAMYTFMRDAAMKEYQGKGMERPEHTEVVSAGRILDYRRQGLDISELCELASYSMMPSEYVRIRYGLEQVCNTYGFLERYVTDHEDLGISNEVRRDYALAEADMCKAAERAVEDIPGVRFPDFYLDNLNRELDRLGRVAASPDAINDLIHIRPDFLVKYGIDRNTSKEERSIQAEEAYRELDARFVKMTGRRPYADELFSSLRRGEERTVKENRPKQSHRTILRNPPSKGRKMSL